jgi:hypothetical protein
VRHCIAESDKRQVVGNDRPVSEFPDGTLRYLHEGTQRVSTLELRKRLDESLNRVALRKDEFVIERRGGALAAFVPVGELARLDLLSRRYVLDVLERQRGGRPTQARADRLADEAKHRGAGAVALALRTRGGRRSRSRGGTRTGRG